MDLETINFLLSQNGEDLLAIAKSMTGSFLTNVTTLRKHYPAPIANAALELIELRKRAAKKFSRAGEMFFTREALEQSSGEGVSHYRADRFVQDSHILDLACGIGGDTIGLASKCYVTAVDVDPVRLAMAERNLAVYGLSNRVKFVCADVTTVPLHADAAFIDPSRRVNGRRTIKLSEISPSVDFIHRLTDAVPDCAVKLSPAMDDSELGALGGEIEFLSESGECKEALVWFGRFSTVPKRATVLPVKASLIQPGEHDISVRPPGEYMYEPDPCVIRAHMVEELASRIGAWNLDAQIAYISSDTLTETPFAQAYKIIEAMPFKPKAVKQRLRALGIGHVIVKKRGVPFEPREIEKQLSASTGVEAILVLTRIAGKPWALICDIAKS